MLRKGFKYLKYIILCLFTLLAVYLLIALLLSVISTRPGKLNCDKDEYIFLATNGVHLDIIIPQAGLESELQSSLNLKQNTAYVAFGWGDKGIYLETPTWGDLKFSTAMQAMFLKSATVMHVTEYQREYKTWQKISICKEQLVLMMDYIQHSFIKNEEGAIIAIPDVGYTDYDKFYEAIGSYNCIKTCNSWVNTGLKKAKIKTAIWSPFDKGVLYQIRGN